MTNKNCLPIICLINGWRNLISKQVIFTKKEVGKEVKMPDGHTYKIFRHMHKIRKAESTGSIFMIRFRFNKFNYQINRILSYIPVPMIAGFPGFIDKVWLNDTETGFWYGLYQWENDVIINEYKKSFVLGMMINRADKNTIKSDIFSDCSLHYFLTKYMY